MSRRLPAPPLPGTPPPEADDSPPAPAEDWDEADDATDESEDTALLDPDAWPDDDDEPTVPEGLLADGEIDEVTDLSFAAHEDDEDDEDGSVLPVDKRPLGDDLTDLGVPEHNDKPVLAWNTEVVIDGKTTPAQCDPDAAVTVWIRPGATSETTVVSLLLVGVELSLPVTQRDDDDDDERVILGSDVLSGRFLLAP